MLPFIILGVVNTYIFLNTGKSPKATKSKKETDNTTGTWTVYGTSWCGWTTKQLEYLKKKGIDHKFVDCEKGKCDGIDAFPVLESPKGERITGYKEV
tara:strand:+ start:2031 stop:2321 length:291 start_codon:yes stop_codon:yes gene_type:complete